MEDSFFNLCFGILIVYLILFLFAKIIFALFGGSKKEKKKKSKPPKTPFSDKEEVKPSPKPVPTNPKTLDNIVLITLLFIVSGLGIYAAMYKKLKDEGLTLKEIKAKIVTIEPFKDNKEFLIKYFDELEED